jgi:hypothetical protein
VTGSAAGATVPRATLSVCLITLDEERRLPRALASVTGLADQIVVVDSGSADRTREIALAAGATVIEHPWRGFAAQRNVALDHAVGEWVLELDADEWCSPELVAEIGEFLAMPPEPGIGMALLPMRQTYLGRMLGPAGHYPFYRSRLFRLGAYRHDESRTVHEGLWARERPWVFTHDLHHELAGTLGEAIRDTRAYARLEAQGIGEVSARALAAGTLVRPPVKFLYQTALLGGWRDGAPGILRSASEVGGDALTWVRAWRRRGGGGGAGPGSPDGHFGRSAPRVGPVHVLAVGDPRGARAWLAGAVRAGAWVSVVCSARDAEPELAGGAPLRVRTVPRLGPLSLLRAIDAESQLAPVDAYVALDRAGAAVLRALPFAAEVIDPRTQAAEDVVNAAR